MAELVAINGPWKVGGAHLALNLYCWPCTTVHTFPLANVEQLIYALGADAADRGPAADRVPVEDFSPSCPREVLRWADDCELYAEHVEQGIECRQQAPDA